MSFFTKPDLIGSGDIKREAKAQLSGKWKSVILLCLVPFAIKIFLFVFTTGVASLPILFNATQSYVESGSLSSDLSVFPTLVSTHTSFLWNVGGDMLSSLLVIGIIYTLIDYINCNNKLDTHHAASS